MTKAALVEKVFSLQSELEVIKTQLFSSSPDYSIDEKNWKNIRSTSKEVRKRLYKERYAK